MQIRIEDETMEGMKNVMAHFLPRYLEYDAGLPREFSYMFDNGMGLLDWKFFWTDIYYSQPKLDMLDM